MTNFTVLPIKRRTMVESFYMKPRNVSVKFVIAVPEDGQVVQEYLALVYSSKELLNVAARITPSDSMKRNKARILNNLNNGRVILALDGLEIVGLVSGTLIERKLDDNANELKIEEGEDFAEKIDSWSNDSLAIRKCDVLINEAGKRLMRHWPKDCQKMIRIGPLAIQNGYEGGGLATKLWFEMMKLAKEHKGIEFVDSICNAKASTAIALKMGMKIAYQWKHSDFCADGKPVLDDFLDGTTSENLVIGNLDEMLSKLDNNGRPIKA